MYALPLLSYQKEQHDHIRARINARNDLARSNTTLQRMEKTNKKVSNKKNRIKRDSVEGGEEGMPGVRVSISQSLPPYPFLLTSPLIATSSHFVFLLLMRSGSKEEVVPR